MKTLDDHDSTEQTEHDHDEQRARDERVVEYFVAGSFVTGALLGLGFAAAVLTDQVIQVQGGLLAGALGALGVGILLWGERLLRAREAVEERHPPSSGEPDREAMVAAVVEEAGPTLTRRPFLVRVIVGVGALFGLSLLAPLASIGPTPGDELKRTAWAAGRRLSIQGEGRLLRPADIALDQIFTVLPEGMERDFEAADAVAVVLRVPSEELRLPPDREAATVDGIVAYSKICTHAGCPVGLYRAQQRSLFCPCHQSQFDVLEGCRPTFGPAARALPQLPIRLDSDGYLVADGDFFEPTGPAFWERGRA